MPLHPPPSAARATPGRYVLGAGTALWRVHGKGWHGTAFKSAGSDPLFGGSRFDSTADDRYSFLYAAPDEQTALLETLARGIPFDERGWRMIRRASVRGQRISAIEPTRDLALISLLSTADLAAACQDSWLIHSSPRDYPQTRRWGQWLRSQADWAQGLIWPSDRHLGGLNLVLFADRCPDEPLREITGKSVDLDDAAGARWLKSQLAPFRISVRAPGHPRGTDAAARRACATG